VRVLRRTGIPGEIQVVFPKLPAGVTASGGVIRAEENQGFVVLTAAPEAQPGAFVVTGAVARAQVEGSTIERPVAPFDVYRINNNPQITYRESMVVSVGPEPEWSVSIEPAQMAMTLDAGPVEVKVRLRRRGRTRDLPFAIVGLANGVQAPRAILFRRDAEEVTFPIRVVSQGVFATRPGGPPPPTRFMLAVVNGREGEAMMMCSPAVPVSVALPGSRQP
jgi:hypothetical protein